MTYSRSAACSLEPTSVYAIRSQTWIRCHRVGRSIATFAGMAGIAGMLSPAAAPSLTASGSGGEAGTAGVAAASEAAEAPGGRVRSWTAAAIVIETWWHGDARGGVEPDYGRACRIGQAGEPPGWTL